MSDNMYYLPVGEPFNIHGIKQLIRQTCEDIYTGALDAQVGSEIIFKMVNVYIQFVIDEMGRGDL